MDKSIDMTLLGETEGGTNYWTKGPSETELEQISTQPLSAYTVSSLVTAGPDAHHLHRILAAINTACLNNDPKTVVDLCAWILVNEQTYYMEVSMIEIILAYSRAYTLINPDTPFFLFYSFLYKMFFKKESFQIRPLKKMA